MYIQNVKNTQKTLIFFVNVVESLSVDTVFT